MGTPDPAAVELLVDAQVNMDNASRELESARMMWVVMTPYDLPDYQINEWRAQQVTAEVSALAAATRTRDERLAAIPGLTIERWNEAWAASKAEVRAAS